jgi:hypothetical protein
LTNSEANHGEDVKEIYYYLDATPTHSYLKMLYKYPQQPFPYEWLVQENRRRESMMPNSSSSTRGCSTTIDTSTYLLNMQRPRPKTSSCKLRFAIVARKNH